MTAVILEANILSELVFRQFRIVNPVVTLIASWSDNNNNNNNNNNSFVNLLKKAFQLNLQFKYLSFPKIPLKNAI